MRLLMVRCFFIETIVVAKIVRGVIALDAESQPSDIFSRRVCSQYLREGG
jgi:hypothetical protein